MKISRLLFFLIITIALQSCGGFSARQQGSADTLKLTDAQLLRISVERGYTLVDIADPWHEGHSLARYALIERCDSGRVSIPSKLVAIYVPLRKSVVATSAHCNLALTLGAQQQIAGVCDAQYILSSELSKQIANGSIANCGSAFSPNTEKIVAIGADAMLVSPFEDDASATLSARTGIPVIECADYMESTPLGRAEWMKFYGRLYGCTDKADSLFNVVKRNYNSLRSKTQRLKNRPKVLTESVYQSVWYCPGGRSTKAQIIADAGGTYAFCDNTQAGSLSLAPERVIAEASDADVWTLTASQMPTAQQFASAYRGYKMVRALRMGRVYVCPSMFVPYFDEVAFRPDWHLKEYVAMLHPELLPNYSLRYYKRLNTK